MKLDRLAHLLFDFLYESVPPKLYGGTERIVSYLTEELVRQKQNVTLFASGDSVTKARLVELVWEGLPRGSGTPIRLYRNARPSGDQLARLGEIEALALGIDGKRALWRSLLAIAEEIPALRKMNLTRLCDDSAERLPKVPPSLRLHKAF